MSIEIYKELNKELVDKLQELKRANACLEKENAYLNAQFQDEYQFRLEEKQKFLSVISRLKENIRSAELYIAGENLDLENRTNTTVSSSRRKTRFSGVTVRSPIRPRSSQTQNDKSGDGLRSSGISNIPELSSGAEETCDENINNTIADLSRLTIYEEQAQSANEESTPEKNQSSNCVPPGEELRSNKSQTESEKIIDSPCCSYGSMGAENVSYSTMRNISSEALHSTPVNQTGSKITAETLIVSNMHDPNDTTSNRPRRHCAPTSLAEPSVSKKLRNESGKSLKNNQKKNKKNKIQKNKSN